LGNVVAVTPKQLAEQKLANKTATAQTNTSATNTTKPANIKTTPTNTTKPETIKTPTISNNKSTNKQMVAATTTVQYSVTIGCFTDTKHQAQLKNLFKLKATENIRTAKHQTNNCWRYMTGNYLSSAEAFKKLAELRKYDKDCQVVRISTKNNKETIEIYKGR
jgi:cell division septation protein DedD